MDLRTAARWQPRRPSHSRSGPGSAGGASSGPWQQAVGPMQFLPGTFTAWAIDADEDGVANPHDIDDAVATAANYLCGGADGSITDERAALLRYNRSDAYATKVLDLRRRLRDAAVVDRRLALPGRRTGQLHRLLGRTAIGRPLAPGRRHVRRLRHAGRRSGRRRRRANARTASAACRSASGATTATTTTAPTSSSYGSSRRPGRGRHRRRLRRHQRQRRGHAPHLHFEIHPGRKRGEAAGAVNPTPTVGLHARDCASDSA